MSECDTPNCVAPTVPGRKRVRFCSPHVVTEVRRATGTYPADYFYTSHNTDRSVKCGRLGISALNSFILLAKRVPLCCTFPLVYRFRKEVQDERRGSVASPVCRALDAALSSVALALCALVGMVAATIVCLTVLLVLKITSVLFSCASQEDIGSSVRHSPPSIDLDTSPFTERLLLCLLGSPVSHRAMDSRDCRCE
jgi:hypothetical protein